MKTIKVELLDGGYLIYDEANPSEKKIAKVYNLVRTIRSFEEKKKERPKKEEKLTPNKKYHRLKKEPNL